MTVKLGTCELARMLGVDKSTIWRWATRKGLPHIKTLGSNLRFDVVAVKDWLEQNGMGIPREIEQLVRRAS